MKRVKSQTDNSLLPQLNSEGRLCCEGAQFKETGTGDVYAIIPAAGKGVRFGQPKIEATYEEKTFIKHILDCITLTPVAGVKVVRDSSSPDMLSSIKIGIDCALKEGWNAAGWLIWPIDHPFVKPETITSLISLFQQKPQTIIKPKYKGKRGHPLIIPAQLILPAKPQPGGLRTVLSTSKFPAIDVEVADPSVVRNVNYKEDLDV